MSFKGGKKDVESVTSVDFPISLKRVNDVKEYLGTKNIHESWEIMFEDAKHTKQFTDIPWSVLRMIVIVYHHDNGKVSSQEILDAIRTMHFSVPLNKRGAKIDEPKAEFGTKIKGVFSKAKDLGAKGVKGVKSGYTKAKDKTTKAVRNKKKDIALDVIYDAKENLHINREEIKTLEKAYNVVEEKYAKGSTVKGVDLSKYEDIETLESLYKSGNKWYANGFKMKHNAVGVGYTKAKALEDLDHHLSYVTSERYKNGANITHKVFPKTDLSQYNLKELYALYGTAERNWKNDNGEEYKRIEEEIQKRYIKSKSNEKYAILVGNIGVLECDDLEEAEELYNVYVHQSEGGYGRAGGEYVALLLNEEPIREHFGQSGNFEEYAKGSTIKGKKALELMSDWELVKVYCNEMGGIDENDLYIEVKGNKQERENMIAHLLQRGYPKYEDGGDLQSPKQDYTIGGL
jgi:hypothetical protein